MDVPFYRSPSFASSGSGRRDCDGNIAVNACRGKLRQQLMLPAQPQAGTGLRDLTP